MTLVTTAWTGGMTGVAFTATVTTREAIGATCGVSVATGIIAMRGVIAVTSGMTGTIYVAIVAICGMTGARTADISITSGTHSPESLAFGLQ